MEERETMSTTSAPAICCYGGCNAVATERDGDGDPCCERCYWQAALDTHFVELRSFDGPAFDADMAKRYEELMAERGWVVTVREPMRGEFEGYTYYKRGDGTLQILYPVPEAYANDSRDCYDAVCSGKDIV
jgi:hypothetical protein